MRPRASPAGGAGAFFFSFFFGVYTLVCTLHSNTPRRPQAYERSTHGHNAFSACHLGNRLRCVDTACVLATPRSVRIR